MLRGRICYYSHITRKYITSLTISYNQVVNRRSLANEKKYWQRVKFFTQLTMIDNNYTDADCVITTA